MPQPFLVLDDLNSFEECWSSLLQPASFLSSLSDVFLVMRLRLCFIGRTTSELKHHFHNILSKAYAIDVVYLCLLLTLITWPRQCPGFLPWELHLCPLGMSLSEGSHCVEPTPKSEELDPPPGGQSMCMKCLEFFCSNICLVPPIPQVNLFNYLCQYKLMDISFIVWVLMQCCFVLLS